MAHDDLDDGGWGTYSAYDLDIFQIDEATRSDFEKVSEVEERRDGWRDYRDMMSDLKADIEAELPNLRENFSSRTGEVYAEALARIVTAAEEHHELAETNRESTDAIAAEVRRVRPLVAQIMADRALAVDNRNALTAIPQDGSNAYDQALDDSLHEARRTFSESNSAYGKANHHLKPPAEYDGPMYTGPDPRSPLGGGYQHAYNPDGTPYRGGDTGSGRPAGGQTPGSTGPELQNPGGTPPPTSTVPPPATPPGPNPGQGTVPPYVPGAPTSPIGPGPGGGPVNPGPSTGKPVAPVGGKPPAGAKPTPGMNRPVPGGAGGTGKPSSMPRTGQGGTGATKSVSAPSSGKGSGTGSKNSPLPNQRRAAAGRTPMTGAGRAPGGANAGTAGPGGSARTGGVAARAANPGAPARTTGGRGTAARPAPNAGFEENLYRDTRSARTVPGVIGGRGGEPAAAGGRPDTARPVTTGKVFGERKGKAETRGAPKLRSGSLTDPKTGSRKDTRHTWQRMPPEPPARSLTGAVALRRTVPKRPTTPEEVAELKLRERKQWRKQFYESLREPRPEPASDLFGGTEGRVTRGVIRGSGVVPPVDRRDSGTRFSTYGWEDD